MRMHSCCLRCCCRVLAALLLLHRCGHGPPVPLMLSQYNAADVVCLLRCCYAAATLLLRCCCAAARGTLHLPLRVCRHPARVTPLLLRCCAWHAASSAVSTHACHTAAAIARFYAASYSVQRCCTRYAASHAASAASRRFRRYICRFHVALSRRPIRCRFRFYCDCDVGSASLRPQMPTALHCAGRLRRLCFGPQTPTLLRCVRTTMHFHLHHAFVPAPPPSLLTFRFRAASRHCGGRRCPGRRRASCPPDARITALVRSCSCSLWKHGLDERRRRSRA